MAKRTGKDRSPKIVSVISLGKESIEKTWKLLLESCEITNVKVNSSPITVQVPTWKQRLTLITPSQNVNSVLDTTKVADIILLVIPAVDGVDAFGQLLISLMKGQGLPTVIGIIQGLEDIPIKQRQQTKKMHTKFF